MSERPAAPTTADLYAKALAERGAIEKFDPKEIRVSEVGHCLRAATLRILGFEGEPATLEQESVFLSGDEHEEHLAALWEAAYPGGVDRQVEVPSPFGTGHMDIWIPALRHYVEAKSTRLKSKPYLPMESHVDQVQLYLHFLIVPTGGGTAEIAYRIKETGMVASFTVAYDPARAEALVLRLQTVKDAVAFGSPLPVPRGYAPDRFPCGWQGADGHLVTCPFWSHCWTAQGERADETAAAAIQAYVREDNAHAIADLALRAVDAKRELAREAAARLMKERGTNALTDGTVSVRRTEAAGGGYYDVRAAIAAGAAAEEALAPFKRRKAGSVRWGVRDFSDKAKDAKEPGTGGNGKEAKRSA